MKAKLTHLQHALSQGMIGREEIIKSALLALVAGEHIVLVGPPGTGKSMVARRMADALSGGENTYFEYLLTKFSTPEELFGALSISELKQDRFVRKTDGFLPTAQVAFLDEIFKASSSILNALLTILNERKFHNGTAIQDTPLQSLISASNELPNGQSELSALYDRFLIRRLVDYVGDDELFKFFDLGDYTPPTDEQKLTPQELHDIRTQAKSVTVPSQIQTVLKNIWQAHNALFKEDDEEFLSDRKFYKVVNLLKISAHTNQRTEVDYSDVLLLKDCLWNNYSDDKIAKIQKLISQEIQKAFHLLYQEKFDVHTNTKNKYTQILDTGLDKYGSGSIDNHQVVEIFVKVGDEISIDDKIMDIENDKVTIEVTAKKNGVVTNIFVNTGDYVCDGDKLLNIDTSSQSNNIQVETLIRQLKAVAQNRLTQQLNNNIWL